MDDPAPVDEKALETRRERAVALFKARMARWQPVQGAAYAVGTVGLVAYLGDQLTETMFLLAFMAAAIAIAVSAGVQAGAERRFRAEMDGIERAFERLKRRRRNR